MVYEVILGVHQLYYGLLAARKQIDVVRAEIAAGEEALREGGNEFKAGVISEAKNAQAVAGTSKAELDQLQARLAHELALAEMDRVAGIRSH